MEPVEIVAGGATLRLEPDRAGRLHQIGFRPGEVARGPYPVEAFPVAYPTWGDDGTGLPALRVTHADGTGSTRLVADGYEHRAIDGGDLHRVLLIDPAEPLEVVLAFRCHEPEGILEQWVEVSNRQSGPVQLHELAAAAPAVLAPEPWSTHFGGDWAGEWTTSEERLTRGVKVLESYGVVRPHLQLCPFFLLSPAGRSTEEEGPVLAGALAWGGAVRLAFGVGHPPRDYVRVWCGHAPTGASYTLDPGESFESPRAYWGWSEAGRAGLSHRWHRLVRDRVVRDGARLRPIVFNNWEATFFDFDEPRLLAMIEQARDLGAELFLLDDGWFGDEFPRADDRQGLGDWVPRPAALPRGLAPLCETASRAGLRFGLWVEPEMVSRASRLYAQHPEWVLTEPVREPREERHQLVLDLRQREVSDFARDTILRLLAETPGISFVKWDANRDVSEPGSRALAADRQANVWVDTVLARRSLMREVADRRPDVELMLCASGGGRTDLDTLRYFHEVWLSDNTDAEQRARMQWAASHFLPAHVIAAHATRWAGQDPVFAAAVAMSARFGFDLDPAALSDDERTALRHLAGVYGGVRDLVQQGTLHRLASPLEGDGSRMALMFTETGGRRAVVFAYHLTPVRGDPPVPELLRLVGLDPRLTYRVDRIPVAHDEEGGTSFERDGAHLAAEGLAWPLVAPRSAAIWELTVDVRGRRPG